MATADPLSVAASAVPFRIPVTYTDMFFGEWNQEKTRHFMEHTNWNVSFVVTAVYLVMVRYGPKMMENRKAFELRTSLAVWNFLLFAYSGISMIVLWPFLTKSYVSGGVIGMLCYNGDLYTHPVSGYWGWLYAMSKGPELIDTLFLVLRKRPIIFLHWYHHSMTYQMSQLFYTEFVPWARPGVITNLGVHTLMYLYYGLRAGGIKTPRWVSKIITVTQITQFLSGFIYFFHLVHAYFNDGLADCNTKPDRMFLGSMVVGSYLYLFIQYFKTTYTEAGRAKKIEEDKAAEAEKLEAKKEK